MNDARRAVLAAGLIVLGCYESGCAAKYYTAQDVIQLLPTNEESFVSAQGSRKKLQIIRYDYTGDCYADRIYAEEMNVKAEQPDEESRHFLDENADGVWDKISYGNYNSKGMNIDQSRWYSLHEGEGSSSDKFVQMSMSEEKPPQNYFAQQPLKGCTPQKK